MTFSIAARCARTGMFGVAVSSSSPAVAARRPHRQSRRPVEEAGCIHQGGERHQEQKEEQDITTAARDLPGIGGRDQTESEKEGGASRGKPGFGDATGASQNAQLGKGEETHSKDRRMHDDRITRRRSCFPAIPLPGAATSSPFAL